MKGKKKKEASKNGLDCGTASHVSLQSDAVQQTWNDTVNWALLEDNSPLQARDELQVQSNAVVPPPKAASLHLVLYSLLRKLKVT